MEKQDQQRRMGRIWMFLVAVLILAVVIPAVSGPKDQDDKDAAPGWTQIGANRQGARSYSQGSSVPTSDTLVLETSVIGQDVFTGDVDGDGALETVTTYEDQLYIYDGQLAIQTQVALPGEGHVTMIEDVDGDGVADIGIGGGGDVRGSAYFYDGTGELLQTFTRDVGYDGWIPPAAVVDGDKILLAGNSGYSMNPRGLYVYDFETGEEVWGYDLGQGGMGQPSLSDIDGDGNDEFVVGWATVHNGGQANGTTDGDLYLVVIDDDGTSLVTQMYPAPSNGSVGHIFVDLDRDGTMEILGVERHDTTYYRGMDQVHLYDTTGKTLYTYDGPNNEDWKWAVADTDGDGKDNVIVGGLSTLVILDEELNELASVDDDGYVELACDLTGDGSPEIVTRNASGLIRVYDSSLDLLDSMQLARVGTIAASDVDADGVVELLIPTTDGEIAVVAFATGAAMATETGGERVSGNGAIRGVIWHDLDRNRNRDSWESGLDGVTVELVDLTTDDVAATVTTASQDSDEDGVIDPRTEMGLYEFKNLPPGRYTVRQQMAAGWGQSVRVIPPLCAELPDVSFDTSGWGEWSSSLAELDTVWEEGDYQDCDPAPYVWKMNDDYYNEVWPRHRGTDGTASGGRFDPESLVRYTPGEEPNVYWLVCGDSGPGSPEYGQEDDFYDFDVRVVESFATGELLVTGYHRFGITQHAITGPDGTQYPVPPVPDPEISPALPAFPTAISGMSIVVAKSTTASPDRSARVPATDVAAVINTIAIPIAQERFDFILHLFPVTGSPGGPK